MKKFLLTFLGKSKLNFGSFWNQIQNCLCTQEGKCIYQVILHVQPNTIFTIKLCLLQNATIIAVFLCTYLPHSTDYLFCKYEKASWHCLLNSLCYTTGEYLHFDNFRSCEDVVYCRVELQTKVCEDFTFTEKAPTRAFSWLKVPTSAFTSMYRHY